MVAAYIFCIFATMISTLEFLLSIYFFNNAAKIYHKLLYLKIVVAKIWIHNKNTGCCKVMNMLWVFLKNILLIYFKGSGHMARPPNFNCKTDK